MSAVAYPVLLVLAAVLTASALTIILALLVARRRAVRGIRMITGGARRLAAGELDLKAGEEFSPDVEELARAFNHMAESLRTMMSNLAAEKDKLAAVLASMSEGVVMVDPDGRVAVANPAAEYLLGTPLPRGQRLIELERDHELHRLLKDCLTSGRVHTGIVEMRQRRHNLAATATPMNSSEGSGALMVLHDISDLRRLEKTRREFVANVSHELRTPLTSIRAAVDTLVEGAISDPAAAPVFLRRIDSEVERMSRLVSDLLELSRLESGQVSPVLSPVHLDILAGEAVQRLSSKAGEKRLRVSVQVPSALLPVMADKDMVLQVLSNLLDNAIKFSPHGRTIAIFADQRQGKVAMTVTDEGPGIPAEHVPHIFERFYKVDSSRAQGGTGLGLAIARHIVLAHGGDISVSSEEGRGSSFTFLLPSASQA